MEVIAEITRSYPICIYAHPAPQSANLERGDAQANTMP
jgi:hypothetical protein